MKHVVTKVWTLLGEISKHDVDMLLRTNANCYIVTDDYPTFTYIRDSNVRINRNQEVQIDTISEEQEMFLKLCFGDRLYHFSTRYDID